MEKPGFQKFKQLAPTLGQPWPFVLSVFISSRLLFLGAGAIAAAVLPLKPPPRLGPQGFLDYWAHWDGAWYAELATEGYTWDAPERTVFFPLYPMLVRFGVFLGGGPAFWGVLVSLVATLLALFFVYRIAEKLWDVKAAKAAVLTFAFFPMAFFLNAVYTEALFVALSVGSVWAAYVRRDLLVAGILGALAAATRNTGVLLLIPLFYEWLMCRREFGWRGLWGVGMVPAGLVGYMIFLGIRFGDPLSFAHQQEAYQEWGRSISDPITTLAMSWTAAANELSQILAWPPVLGLGEGNPTNTFNLAFFGLFLVLMVIGFFVLPRGLSVYTLLALMIPTLTPKYYFPLQSLPRFMLVVFPLFLVLGYLFSSSRLTPRSRYVLLYLWLLLSSGLGIGFAALFVTSRWVA